VFKSIALIPRRRDLSRDSFREYYESRHAPLAIRHIDSFVKYVRNHVVFAEPEVSFDTLSEFWFESGAANRALIAWHATPSASVLHEDEARFMDRGRVIALPVVETVVLGSTRPVERAPVIREALLFVGNRENDESLARALGQLASDWARRDGLVRVCLDLPLSTADVLPEWTRNAEVPTPSALLTAWRRESANGSSNLTPTLPPGAAELGCTHHLVLRCVETPPELLHASGPSDTPRRTTAISS
jgi:EthD domain